MWFLLFFYMISMTNSPSFGGFASKYIRGKFFMDVHPPLAKMLIALTGWLAGFDGKFDFKEIGKDYLEPGVPYVAMRLLSAICGVTLAPAIFLTLKAHGCRTTTAALGSGLVIFGESSAMRNTSTFQGHVLTHTLSLSPSSRERPPHSSSSYPSRLSSRGCYRVHRTRVCLVLEPARTRTREGVSARLVVLAHHDWSRARHHC